MTTLKKWTALFFISACICMSISLSYFYFKAKNKNRSYQFKGKVDSVSYTIKGDAYVFIHGVKYYLSDNDWDFDHNRIIVGDSLIKKRNSMIVKLIKTDGSVVIEGKD
ncbi:hypothetical protein [Mucilaginibacter sp. FT3.2]|uniref:hypothetical protein n=1 Tax=Mucilaginibacter sp. FT3.2 TaxID=2723090 RepID=UPI00161CAC9E|nr:hypothetical protein [Mucilaginibacter sp. FT3.2]MBB6232033.1 hypothetical protein [Mucilaginibacter sp. FT3.2]